MKPHIGPINAALPTPLDTNKNLDEESLRRLCSHCIEIGLDGIFILGSMGEGTLLPESARARAVEIVQEELGSRDIKIFVSAADVSAERMRERAERYASLGADYAILMIPQNLSIEKGIDELHRVADSSEIPCGYYEVPVVTQRALSFNQLKRVLAHDNIHIFKDSSNNALFAQGISEGLLKEANVTTLDGVEFRAAFSARLGYDGVLHGGGALTARRVRRIWQLVSDGRLEEAIELDRRNSLFLAAIYDRFLTATRATIGQKYALKLLTVFSDESLLLDQELDADARERIGAVLSEHHDELFATLGG